MNNDSGARRKLIDRLHRYRFHVKELIILDKEIDSIIDSVYPRLKKLRGEYDDLQWDITEMIEGPMNEKN